TSEQLSTLQGKITNVGASVKQLYTLAFAANGHPIDLTVFRPFYRTAYVYASDYSTPQTFAAATQELASVIDSIATLPTVTDGGVDTDGGLSFALSVVKNGSTKVFESVIDTTDTRLLLWKLLSALSSNSSAADQIASFDCALGLPPGSTAVDVTGVVS